MKAYASFRRRLSSSAISLLLFSLTLAYGACRNQSGAGTNSSELNVAAASNLTDAFTEMGKQFTARTGIRVVNSFGATADLARQVENGAPFDVFASADTEHVDGLERSGLLLPDTKNVYARGRLVMWIPPGPGPALERVEDVARAEVERIAVAKPDLAPYGRATVEALTAMGLWPGVEPKVVYAQNVSQARQYAATGNAEVAFIPLALVKPGEGRYIEIDERLHRPIDQAIAALKDARNQEAARRFVSFVMSPEGQALLARYGYKRSDE